jgi:hypothetical protein
MTTIFGFDARAEVWLTARNADSVPVPGLDGGLSMDSSKPTGCGDRLGTIC